MDLHRSPYPIGILTLLVGQQSLAHGSGIIAYAVELGEVDGHLRAQSLSTLRQPVVNYLLDGVLHLLVHRLGRNLRRHPQRQPESAVGLTQDGANGTATMGGQPLRIRRLRPYSAVTHVFPTQANGHLLLSHGRGVVEHRSLKHRMRYLPLHAHAERLKAVMGEFLQQSRHTADNPRHHGLYRLRLFLIERTTCEVIARQRRHRLKQQFVGHRIAVDQYQRLSILMPLGGELFGDVAGEIMIYHEVARPQPEVAVQTGFGGIIGPQFL